MNKSLLILVLFTTAAFTFSSAQAQSNQVDPGISVNNYKHPNKAAKAKQYKKGAVEVTEEVQTSDSQKSGSYVSTTPKYAPRSASFVISDNKEKESTSINPLTSPGNYKTPARATKNKKSGTDFTRNSPDSLAMP